MARSTRATEIEGIVREFAGRIEEVVRRAVAEQVRAYAAELRGRSPEPAGERMCPFPGCDAPAAGPRNRWRCRAHKDAVIPDAPAPRAVRVQRLPPGPRPGEKRRAGPPMECRAAGCTLRSRGPRFNFFCAEHYRALNAEEQRAAIASWRERRDGKGAAPAEHAPFEGRVLRRTPAKAEPSAPAPETASPTSESSP
jgi:hypothetical protein